MYAIIDIGSNSIRYMEQESRKKQTFTTRLGKGLAQTGCMQKANMDKSLSVISALASNARHKGFVPVAYATSAVRDASNRNDFLDELARRCRIVPSVLTGEQEAVYAYRAAVGSGGCMLDIGGASFQIVSDASAKSFPIGCVRAMDAVLSMTGLENCDDNWTFQRQVLTNLLHTLLPTTVEQFDEICGIGGTITTLAALMLQLGEFRDSAVHGSVLTRQDIEDLIFFLHQLGKKRKDLTLLRRRHDVILYGAVILASAMDKLHAQRVRISTTDGMEGFLMHLKDNQSKKTFSQKHDFSCNQNTL